MNSTTTFNFKATLEDFGTAELREKILSKFAKQFVENNYQQLVEQINPTELQNQMTTAISKEVARQINANR